jgi:hypothetical protein
MGKIYEVCLRDGHMWNDIIPSFMKTSSGAQIVRCGYRYRHTQRHQDETINLFLLFQNKKSGLYGRCWSPRVKSLCATEIVLCSGMPCTIEYTYCHVTLVTIHVFLIDDRIYWTLTQLVTALHKPYRTQKVFSVLQSSLAVSRQRLQRCTFPFLWVSWQQQFSGSNLHCLHLGTDRTKHTVRLLLFTGRCLVTAAA